MFDFDIQVNKLCVRCGEDISIYAKFCSRCGKEVMFKILLETDLGKAYFDYSVSGQVKKILQFRTRFLEKYNSIMKIIKDKYFGEEEEIIIELPKERNVLEKNLGDIRVGLIYSVPILIFIIVGLTTRLFGMFAPNLFLVMICGFSAMLAVALYPLIRGILSFHEIKKYVPMSVKELKSYPELDLITNQRWISKSFDIIRCDVTSDLKRGIERLGDDYLSIDLNAVEIKIDHMFFMQDFTIRVLDNSTGAIIHSSYTSSTIRGARTMVSKLEEKISLKNELQKDGSYRITF